MSDCILAASNLASRVLDMPRDYAGVLGVSRTIMNHSEQAKMDGIRLGAVARKRAKPPLLAFGARLAELRGKRSRQEISNALRTRGASLDESTLLGYERGLVWSVDVTVMLGLAAVLSVPFGELTTLLVANRANPDATDWDDLLRPPPEYQSTLPEGSADVSAPAAQARILDELERLRRENSELEATLSDVRDLTRKLFTLAVRGAEDGETAPTEAEGRKDGRRTGR